MLIFVNTADIPHLACRYQDLLTTFKALQCAEGYQGMMCGVCNPDTHGRWLDRCLRCNAPAVNRLYVIGALLLMCAYVAVTVFLQLRVPERQHQQSGGILQNLHSLELISPNAPMAVAPAPSKETLPGGNNAPTAGALHVVRHICPTHNPLLPSMTSAGVASATHPNSMHIGQAIPHGGQCYVGARLQFPQHASLGQQPECATNGPVADEHMASSTSHLDCCNSMSVQPGSRRLLVAVDSGVDDEDKAYADEVINDNMEGKNGDAASLLPPNAASSYDDPFEKVQHAGNDITCYKDQEPRQSHLIGHPCNATRHQQQANGSVLIAEFERTRMHSTVKELQPQQQQQQQSQLRRRKQVQSQHLQQQNAATADFTANEQALSGGLAAQADTPYLDDLACAHNSLQFGVVDTNALVDNTALNSLHTHGGEPGSAHLTTDKYRLGPLATLMGVWKIITTYVQVRHSCCTQEA